MDPTRFFPIVSDSKPTGPRMNTAAERLGTGQWPSNRQWAGNATAADGNIIPPIAIVAALAAASSVS